MKLGEEFYPSNPSKGTKKMAFSPENLKIWVHSREYSRHIQTATYPPFMKGTQLHPLLQPLHPWLGVQAFQGVP